MPKVRVIKNLTETGQPRFMEGWKPGDVVDMDDISVVNPLKDGFVELLEEMKPTKTTTNSKSNDEVQPEVKKLKKVKNVEVIK